jgi:fermentation-respiration switch protein FrsA (DUF1100 family)
MGRGDGELVGRRHDRTAREDGRGRFAPGALPTSGMDSATSRRPGGTGRSARRDAHARAVARRRAHPVAVGCGQVPAHRLAAEAELLAEQKVTGDLYLPKSRTGQRLPALAVSGPFGAVKEQSSGLYAQTMAERGFVTLAFDPSFTGESGGEPRHTASPDINTEDFSAAVNLLGLQASVDRKRIGALGICGFSGMALTAATSDSRIRAVATVSMYDMSRSRDDSPRPILLVAGQNAHSRYDSEDVHKVAAEPKELVIVPGADHVDLYDRMDKIPFDKLTEFFAKNLASGDTRTALP